MAKPPPQPQLPPITTGVIDRVPCPHCGKPNNFRSAFEMLEIGNTFSCDHCKQPVQVVGVRDVKMVSLRRPRGQVTLVKSGR